MKIDTMKAAICTKYGGPEVIQIQKVERPTPKNDEILVKVMATTINSGDVSVRALKTNGLKKLAMKFTFGFTKPRKSILGTVFSGTVEQIGNKVKNFNIDDEVFGVTGFKFGTHAEYLTISEKKLVTKKPINATFNQSASILFGGQTAIYFLQKAKIQEKPNCKVLIIGATGSVGSAAIQIAQYYKSVITTVCHSNDEEFIKTFNSNHFIFYNQEDFTKSTLSYDIIFDASGKFSKKQCAHLLNNGGVFKTVGGMEYATETIEQLEMLRELYENRKYQAVIDKIYQFDEIVEAHKHIDSGRKKGNTVIEMK
ncbi:NAD(P)-dependent alcohol dehydrogenase [Aquimarina sp. 2201CG5-10]|uniref:NAD(P)-dependent alcohol dehydrogenase n=1 Tax=Aquimarina callyspongiae TaxID=3098150 RepID=UPI002AB37673|nr:NAD(P)-dependent alcohol dehydrogenase [Aquimarina sp. 2201CG5-10]MDY8137283.1 NAD(P)-dependent alcohol dehydrogenase [Aquimarina sp. 2201CG5-10]